MCRLPPLLRRSGRCGRRYIYVLHPLIITNGIVMHVAFEALSSLYGREVNVWSPATAGSAAAMLLPVAFVCTVLRRGCNGMLLRRFKGV